MAESAGWPPRSIAVTRARGLRFLKLTQHNIPEPHKRMLWEPPTLAAKAPPAVVGPYRLKS